MCVYKKKGNITLIANIFLIMSLIFFCGIFKLIKYSVYGGEDLIIYKSGIDFEDKREKIIKVLQEYSNVIEMEEGKIYRYRNEEVQLELKKLYDIENLQLSYKGKVANIEYRETGKVKKIEVYREKMKVCECENINCDFGKEEIILIPQKGVKKSV